MADKPKPTQKTRPKRGKPIEIPVPSRKDLEDFMRGVAGKRPQQGKDVRDADA